MNDMLYVSVVSALLCSACIIRICTGGCGDGIGRMIRRRSRRIRARRERASMIIVDNYLNSRASHARPNNASIKIAKVGQGGEEGEEGEEEYGEHSVQIGKYITESEYIETCIVDIAIYPIQPIPIVASDGSLKPISIIPLADMV